MKKKNPTKKSGFLLSRIALAIALFLGGISLSILSLAGGPSGARVAKQEAVERTPQQALESLATGAKIEASQLSSKTGVYSFVRAAKGQVLAASEAKASPMKRAMSFLASHGEVMGLNSTERDALRVGMSPEAGSDLKLAKVDGDEIGMTHVRFDQSYKGLKVFGAQLVVHMTEAGVTGVNGEYVPNVSLSTIPTLTAEVATDTALTTVRKTAPDSATRVDEIELAIYPLGLLEGKTVTSRLAYAINVSGAGGAEQVWVDAQTGAILLSLPLHQTVLNRTIYSPQYDPSNPDLFVQRREGDPPHPTPMVNNLYDFAGQTYNFYSSAFGRDSFDGAGKHMISVYLINEKCPNAYWNGQSTNYCPAFDADDVVSHEWSHAYTEYTHGLIYAFQSGALNESYSDIFGESVDLINNSDGIGGNNNAQPYPNGQRWLVGEDLGQEVQELLLRDMYDPDRLGDPSKVSSVNYACGTADGGGVHTNSGVPNHAYAFVVDGTQFLAGNSYNGQTITGIGMTKTAAIYFRAESVYQTPTTDFKAHDIALQTSCSDLIGQPLKTPVTTSATGAVSADVINASDCQQVAKAMLAVEMSMTPPCATGPLLSPDAAPICSGSNTIFSENWETGGDSGAAARGWTKTSMGFGTGLVDWEDSSKAATRFFHVVSSLPGGRTGSAAFAVNPKVGQLGGGTCAPGGDYSGSHTIDSPGILIPAGATTPLLSFDHYVATEAGVDGGQVEISRNGGAYALLPNSAYIFNAPNTVYNQAAPVGNNTGPNPNEAAWTGTNLGSAVLGSWGTTLVNLSSVAQPGDTIKIRFTWSQDGCNGVEGWYIDNVRVFSCPVLTAPTLSVGADYENPDTNGSFTLNWVRPPGAVGPDTLQESRTSCAPLLFDNAENGLVNWNVSTSGTGAQNWTTSNLKPQHSSNTFNVQGVNGVTNADSYLTYKNPITIPSVGQTFLNFLDWDDNEGEDKVLVEVSENNGTTWVPVYTHSRSETGTGAVSFATEALFSRSVSLANFGGKTIRLRFRYSLGGEDRPASQPYGWYVDDIAMVNEAWTDVVTTSGTSALLQRGSGTYCYRVETTYLLDGQPTVSLPSNVASVTVVPGITSVVSRKVHAGTHDIPLPLAGTVGIEPRRGVGSPLSHQVVFQFGTPVTHSGATVTSTGNTAQVDSVVTSGNEVAVNLSNVADQQTISVTLLNVVGDGPTHSITVPMGVLLGDVNQSRTVDSGDLTIVRQNNLQGANDSNFKADVTSSGLIDSGDVTVVRQQNLKSLP